MQYLNLFLPRATAIGLNKSRDLCTERFQVLFLYFYNFRQCFVLTGLISTVRSLKKNSNRAII